MQSKAKILLIYTGGTIGMMKDFETGALKAFNFSKLLQRIPELKQLDCEIETISFEKPIDSSNINPEMWNLIATMIEENYETYDGFVVLHGSDTMSYSASALSFMLENLETFSIRFLASMFKNYLKVDGLNLESIKLVNKQLKTK